MIRYFAYGSNLHPLRLQERVPSARVVGVATLPGHELRFHKRADDGSGKCDAFETGAGGASVLGVLFDFDEVERPALDAAEDVGRSYEASDVTVHTADDVAVRALTYRALPQAIAPGVAPWSWYWSLVVLGARFHDLPVSYVATIEDVRHRPDPDPDRAATHEALLDRIRRWSA